MKKSICLIILTAIFNINGQSSGGLKGTLKYLSGDAVEQYVSPVVSAFGSNLNSGWVNSIPPDVAAEFNIELTISAQGSYFSDGKKYFTSRGIFRFNEQQARTIVNSSVNADQATKDFLVRQVLSESFTVSISGPTIVGNKDQEVTVMFPGKTYTTPNGTYSIPAATTQTGARGFLGQIPLLPMAVVQLNVGTLLGTDVALRFVPGIDLGELGEYNFRGIGIITNPKPYLHFLRPLPFNLGFGIFYQKMEVSNVFESSALQYGIYASKQFGVFIPYGGITFETSSTTVTYDYEFSVPSGEDVQTMTSSEDVDLESENTFALILGSKLKFGFLGLFLDFKFARVSTFNTGISVGF